MTAPGPIRATALPDDGPGPDPGDGPARAQIGPYGPKEKGRGIAPALPFCPLRGRLGGRDSVGLALACPMGRKAYDNIPQTRTQAARRA